MNKSETTKELALALSKAQAEMPPAELNAVNPFLKNKYADLGSIIKAAKPVLAKHGLSLSQLPTSDGDKIGVTTILMHSSGEWISSILMLPMVKQDPQAAGSAITYARRYSLQSMAGIPSEDDDGQQASKPAKKSIINIVEVAKECGWTLQQVCESFDPPVKSVKDIQDLEACAAYLRSNKI